MVVTRNSLSLDLSRHLAGFLVAYQAADRQIAVGLSGGCDSVVLLHALSRLDPALRLSAIHVDHGLSPNAADWRVFCENFCKSLDIPLLVQSVTVNRKNGLGLEAAARQARYAVFRQSAADCLLLAQHRGDQAETVLFNLLRGSGVTGASGMPAERQLGALRLLRPLLPVSRADLLNYAQSHGLTWVDDESNADTALTRNFLRHEVLTVINQRFPAAESALAQAACNFSEAVGLLDELAAQDCLVAQDGETAQLTALRTLTSPRLKNLLRYRLRQLGWQVPVAARLDEFVRQLLIAAPGRHPELSLPDGRMQVAQRRLHWLPQK